MKVKYCKIYTDQYGDTFLPGWVAEHTDAEAARRIALNVCTEVDKESRSRRGLPDAPPSVECVPERKDGLIKPLFNKTK